MSSDWWSRKLGNDNTPQRYTPPLPPTQAPIRLPIQVPNQQQQQLVNHQNFNNNLLDPSRAPTDQIPMGEAIHLWKGGEATRKEGNLSCPSCGSHLVFSRSKGGIAGKQPAPRCFSCGYNGIYDQGDQSNWAV